MENKKIFESTTITTKKSLKKINSIIRKKRKKWWHDLIYLTIPIVLLVSYNEIIKGKSIFLVAIFPTFFLSLVFCLKILYLFKLKNNEKNSGQKLIYQIFENGLKILSENSEIFMNFKIVDDFIETKEYYYLLWGGKYNISYFSFLKKDFMDNNLDEFIKQKIFENNKNTEKNIDSDNKINVLQKGKKIFENKSMLDKNAFKEINIINYKKNIKWWHFIPLFFIIPFYVLSFYPISNFQIILIIIIILVFFLLLYFAPQLQSNFQINKQKEKFEKETLYKFYEEGIQIKTKNLDSFMKFNLFKNFTETKNCFCLLYNFQNQIMFLSFDKNGFIFGESNEFKNFMKQKI